jgi:hypothetical protein
MKREGVQQDGDGWVVVWDRDDRCRLKFELDIFVKISYFPFRAVWAKN